MEKLKKEFIIVLEIKNEGADSVRHFFGSVSAIFDMFSHEELCVNQNILYKHCFSEEKPYENDKCRISKQPVYRRAWKPKEKPSGCCSQ